LGVLDWKALRMLEDQRGGPELSFDTSTLWRMKTVWNNVFHSKRPNPVNPEGQ
jgi:hypothetical protein